MHIKSFAVSSWLHSTLSIGLLTIMAVLCAHCAFAVTCSVVKHIAPSDAEKAYLAADFEKAAGLYRAALEKQPGDIEATIGLVHSLLRQAKLAEASDLVKEAVKAAPNSAALITLRGELELRAGEPWLVEPTVMESYKINPCNPRTRLLYARFLAFSSRYATARQQILIAHEFDPEDPEIRATWIQTLPTRQAVSELEAYLALPNGEEERERNRTKAYLDYLKGMENQPRKACRLVSAPNATEIPFVKLMGRAQHLRAFGLEVGLNTTKMHLQIDTGAGGLLLYRSAAERAGLKRIADVPIGGIAREDKHGYTALADSIHVGGLKFQNCTVQVIDAPNPFDDEDGLIGTNVFGGFLVTLDYPMRNLRLEPLPPRPGAAPTVASLSTESAPENASSRPDSDESEGPILPASESKNGAVAPLKNGTSKPDLQQPVSHGPYDRYVAPEMKDYTPVYRVGHLLIVPAALNNEKIKLFVLDTGAFQTIISQDVAREVTKLHENSFEISGLNGSVDKVYQADEITFNFAHLSQRVTDAFAFDTGPVSRAVGMQISGFIGANTLKLLIMHIDYRDGLVKFEFIPDRGYKYQ